MGTLRRSPWALRLLPGAGRFPRAGEVVPQAAAATATVKLDTGELAFVSVQVGGLP